jgi:hypothetical protein
MGRVVNAYNESDTNGCRILDLKFEILNFRFDMQEKSQTSNSPKEFLRNQISKYVLLACKIGT